MGLTVSLAEFIVKAKYEDLPQRVVQAAKTSFIDTMGLALAGSVEDGSKILTEFVQRTGGNPVASLIARGFKSSTRNAALANGLSGDIVGASETTSVMIHASMVVLPAVWALAEETRASGKDVILAHVLGVEAACKIARPLHPALGKKGWHPSSVFGVFGATAAAGKILGLDAWSMANALGIAGIEASGTKAGMGTMSKAYSRASTAEHGVVAATLARMGFTGPTTILEGLDGFLQTFGDGVSGDSIVPSLGNPFEFDSPGVILKPYPACTCSHTTVEGMLRLRAEHGLKPGEVESVECFVTPAVANMLKFPDPKDPFEAKYSLQFCCAAALVDGAVDMSTFTREKLADAEIINIMKRTKMTVSHELARLGYDPAGARFSSTVVVRLKSGEEYRSRQDLCPWGPENPPSHEEVLSKYRANAKLVLGPDLLEESIRIMEHLEDSRDIQRLMDIVRG